MRNGCFAVYNTWAGALCHCLRQKCATGSWAEASAGQEDGILTAEEAALLDLEGTEWVVLSGCDTGIGEIKAGEGVLGLRRAFQEAGARTVITSLWPVEDEEVRAWMTSLYRIRFVRKMPTAE